MRHLDWGSMSDPEFNELLRAALDEVQRSHAEINQIRKLAEAWITDSIELMAQSWGTEDTATKVAVLGAINSCGQVVLGALRDAKVYTDTNGQVA